MAYSYIRYAGNGSTTNYVFSFPYISADHIQVRVNGVVTTLFSFLNSSTVQMTSAPASGAILEIRRVTPKDNPIVNFTDGSVLLERDLDLLATFDLYLAQETKDNLEGTIQQNASGVFDALSKRVINVADPVAAQDAVTKNWVETTYTATIEAISLASAASASASATSAGNAATSATNASGSAVSAASSAASAAALLDNFDDRYLGPKAADPAVDNDGAALVIGAIYFNNVSGRMKVYTSLGWADSSSAAVASMVTYEYVATAGQTTFSGADAEANSLSYTVGGLIVTLNGLTLRPGEDYTATTGTSIVLVSAATVGDELQVHAFNNFSVASVQSSAVSYAPTGTGAVATTVQAKLRESVSIKDFGADLTGVIDSAHAIRKAIAHAKTLIGTPSIPYSDYEYKEYLIAGLGEKSVEIDMGTGILRIDSTILTPGCITYKGSGVTIISSSNSPLFETAYYASDVLTTNFGFVTENEAITNSAMSGLRFENLSFYDVSQPFKLRVALWQSHIKDCVFNNCGYAVVANSCFFFKYQGITIRGVKTGYETVYPVSLGISTNNVEFCNSSISTRTNGLYIENGASINIYGNNFDAITNNAIWLNVFVSHVSIHDNYLEHVSNFVVDLAVAGSGASSTTNGEIKYYIDIYDNYCYTVSYYVDLCGLRNSHIGSIVDQVLPEFRCLVRLRGGANSNEAIVDIPIGISDAAYTTRYLISQTETVIRNRPGSVWSGLKFPATQTIVANVNTLDDYKEGTWSPTLIGTTIAGAGTYSVRSGLYTKIGNVVTFRINLTWSAHTGTGDLRISDLPYAIGSSGNSIPFSVISYSLLTGAGRILGASGNGGTGSIGLITLPTGGGAYGFLAVASSGDIAISGSYSV